MRRSFSPQTDEALETAAQNAVRAEVGVAIQLSSSSEAALASAHQALDYARQRAASTRPPPGIWSNLLGDRDRLFYGFERGAVPAGDLLWSLRNFTDLSEAVAQASHNLATAYGNVTCASAAAVARRVQQQK